MKTFTIAFSPCPNDTFIFDAMVHQKIDTKGLSFKYVLEDVETLNQWALAGKHDISKISYAVLPELVASYSLLLSGSALGKGVGPLLLTAQPLPENTDISQFLSQARIAIPGLHTTANFLLSAAYPDAQNKEVVLFSDIEQAVLEGRYDVGLVIHESRFTYQERGLFCLQDMGQWWEQNTQMPIPLGGIVLKKSISSEDAQLISQLIQESITYAWHNYPELGTFVSEHAQEMSEEVMRKHINLYVNKNSINIDEEGRGAIRAMLERSHLGSAEDLHWID